MLFLVFVPLVVEWILSASIQCRRVLNSVLVDSVAMAFLKNLLRRLKEDLYTKVKDTILSLRLRNPIYRKQPSSIEREHRYIVYDLDRKKLYFQDENTQPMKREFKNKRDLMRTYIMYAIYVPRKESIKSPSDWSDDTSLYDSE